MNLFEKIKKINFLKLFLQVAGEDREGGDYDEEDGSDEDYDDDEGENGEEDEGNYLQNKIKR